MFAFCTKILGIKFCRKENIEQINKRDPTCESCNSEVNSSSYITGTFSYFCIQKKNKNSSQCNLALKMNALNVLYIAPNKKKQIAFGAQSEACKTPGLLLHERLSEAQPHQEFQFHFISPAKHREEEI